MKPPKVRIMASAVDDKRTNSASEHTIRVAGVTLGVGGVIAFCVLGGAVLRLIFPNDIEYKADEQWLFEHTLALLAGGPWPWSGMSASNDTPFAGLNIWMLATLARLRGAATPPQLANAIQLANVAALGLFCSFIFVAIPRHRRERWLWAAALWAVDPIAIVLERKIWLPSLLPLPAVAFYAAWWLRRASIAAFVWGVLGTLIPQIHTGAALLTGAIAVWTVLFDRSAFPWKPWLAGSIAGALSALPWVIELAETILDQDHWLGRWRFPNATYFLRWATQPFGIGTQYVLGRDYHAFLAAPDIGGSPSYLIGGIQIILWILMLGVFAQACAKCVRSAPQTISAFLRAILPGRDPEAMLVNAALWGYGTMLTLLTIGKLNANRHYLLIVMPLMALWCVRLITFANPKLEYRRLVLGVLCLLQLTFSAALLIYIDKRQVVDAYGPTWQFYSRK
jgi:hypothetical protein